MGEQNIVIKDRKSIVITGVVSVDSYDDRTICATTEGNIALVVEGTDLKLCDVNPDKNTLEAEGLISAVFYDEKLGVKRNIFGFIKK